MLVTINKNKNARFSGCQISSSPRLACLVVLLSFQKTWRSSSTQCRFLWAFSCTSCLQHVCIQRFSCPRVQHLGWVCVASAGKELRATTMAAAPAPASAETKQKVEQIIREAIVKVVQVVLGGRCTMTPSGKINKWVWYEFPVVFLSLMEIFLFIYFFTIISLIPPRKK